MYGLSYEFNIKVLLLFKVTIGFRMWVALFGLCCGRKDFVLAIDINIIYRAT